MRARRAACAGHLLLLVLHAGALLCCLPALAFTVPVHLIYCVAESVEARRVRR